MRIVLLCFAVLSLASCAISHHVQVGDIDNSRQAVRNIDIKVSETGINLKETAAIVRALHGNKGSGTSSFIEFMELFQMGPRTGNPVYFDRYADNVLDLVLAQCPSGDVGDLISIRETTKYPVVSGEIVKITGKCFQ